MKDQKLSDVNFDTRCMKGDMVLLDGKRKKILSVDSSTELTFRSWRWYDTLMALLASAVYGLSRYARNLAERHRRITEGKIP